MTQTYEQKLQANRESRARRALLPRRPLICKTCGETLRQPTPDDRCGFCREGIPMDSTSPNWKGAAA